MEGVYLTKLGFNWVGLMQARCLFFDQLQWHRKLDMASMVRWLCTTSDAEGGRLRHTMSNSSHMFGLQKEAELRQRQQGIREPQFEFSVRFGETDDGLAKVRLRANDVI